MMRRIVPFVLVAQRARAPLAARWSSSTRNRSRSRRLTRRCSRGDHHREEGGGSGRHRAAPRGRARSRACRASSKSSTWTPGDEVKEHALVAKIQIIPNMVNLNAAESRVAEAELSVANATREFERYQEPARAEARSRNRASASASSRSSSRTKSSTPRATT